MTREEQIKKQADIYTDDASNYAEWSDDGGWSETNDIELVEKAFVEGAKWADANPNKKLVYTKQELLDMGFGFDLNGNISTPQEIEERTKKYINYRKDKWVKDACEWLDIVNTDDYMDSGIFQMYDLIMDFKKAMEK